MIAPVPTAAQIVATEAPKPVRRPWPDARAAAANEGDRIYSKVRFLWIRPKPRHDVEWIAYLSIGESVRVRGGDAKQADAGPGTDTGCTRWYAVEPRGFICAGQDATLDSNDADFVELKKSVAKDEPLPYEYGESLGTAVYLNVPPKRRQYFRETAYREHMAAVERARKSPSDIDRKLVGVDLRPTGNPPPKFLLHLGPRSRPQKTGGKYGFPEVVGGSTIAYFYSFDAADRTWIMSWDRGVIPKDRVRVFPRSKFHGVALGGDARLPLAFFRRRSLRYARSGAAVTATSESWSRYARVGLTGERVVIGGTTYLVTRDRGLLCAASDVAAPMVRSTPPKSVDAKRTWIDISITGGWLVAYEGPKPVYTTMISPGRGGLPEEGKTLLETASTPVGDFTVTGKFHTATMTSNFSDKVVHSEVPYTQNFRGPYAMHAAYWHDEWGVGKSGGCVNLSPTDAHRLFAWTEPRLPQGWHGMRAIQSDAAAYERATVISLHR